MPIKHHWIRDKQIPGGTLSSRAFPQGSTQCSKCSGLVVVLADFPSQCSVESGLNVLGITGAVHESFETLQVACDKFQKTLNIGQVKALPPHPVVWYVVSRTLSNPNITLLYNVLNKSQRKMGAPSPDIVAGVKSMLKATIYCKCTS